MQSICLPQFQVHLSDRHSTGKERHLIKPICYCLTDAARENTGKQQYRVMLNQDDVLSMLTRRGYAVNVVDFADLSMEEQVWSQLLQMCVFG